jgi:hypothetical protein
LVVLVVEQVENEMVVLPQPQLMVVVEPQRQVAWPELLDQPTLAVAVVEVRTTM